MEVWDASRIPKMVVRQASPQFNACASSPHA
jgi:hypothetical protein